VVKELSVARSKRYPVAAPTLLQFAAKLLVVTLVAVKAVGAAGVGAAVGVGVAVGVAVAVAVGVGVGVGLGPTAQYLPPVSKWTLLVFAPPQTIISLPVQSRL